jgi:pterin-4a-carbinolamine dehydratase
MATNGPSGGSIGNLIFLSYRRADATPQTLALKLELERRLSAVQVFMDNSAIQGGQKFPDAINNALGTASLIIAVMGKDWFGGPANGIGRQKRRIDDPTDWVFKEIKIAIETKPGALLPVLIDNALNLSKCRFPKKLAELPNINAVPLMTSQWDASVDHLVKLLERRFEFATKQQTYEYPRPDTLKAKTPPYPWDDLKSDLRASLPGWTLEFSDDPERVFYKWVNLRRDFRFRTFDKAVEFANVIAQHSKDEEHHPQFLVSWKTVSVWTSTWDAGHRITPYDVAFAKFLERKYRAGFAVP